MDCLEDVAEPREIELLVAFSDLRAFGGFARSRPALELLDALSTYYELVGDVAAEGGGRVVKFIGDAVLLAFGREDVDRGVLALRELKQAGDSWFAARDASCRHMISADFGRVVAGTVGTRTEKRLDVFGETVNTAATLRSNGFALTPRVFRKLQPETRTLFKKHTPPITYIPVEESHRD